MGRIAIIIFMALGFAVLLPVTAQAASGAYVALGDSVAAGSGLSGSTSTLCDRSTQAYPHIVAQETGLSLEHYACVGAKADEGIYDIQERRSTELPAQLDQAFSTGTPGLISMTVGANDVRWTQFIRQCYFISCGLGVDTALFKVYLADLKLELDTVMTRIDTFSDGEPPQVIVTGYHDPFSSEDCSATSELSSREISWLEDRVDNLNSAIRQTVEDHSFAEFAPVDFAGHELCADDSWVQDLSDARPFHPTAEGQQAIAEAVLDEYSSVEAILDENEMSDESFSDSSETEVEAPVSHRERVLDWLERVRQ